LVSPGDQIVSLDDTSEMKLDLYIPIKYLSYLKQGQNVTLRSS
jgi:membrane fusion protein (multidrug efflux system)